MKENMDRKPYSFRFDQRAINRLDDLKTKLQSGSRTEVLEIALKALNVLADMADDQNKVSLLSGNKELILYLD